MEKLTEQLREMGFSDDEIGYYLKLSAAGECSFPQRLRILMKKRRETLDEIHRLEGRIIRMDTMRREIRRKT